MIMVRAIFLGFAIWYREGTEPVWMSCLLVQASCWKWPWAEYESSKRDYVYGAQMRLARIYVEVEESNVISMRQCTGWRVPLIWKVGKGEFFTPRNHYCKKAIDEYLTVINILKKVGRIASQSAWDYWCGKADDNQAQWGSSFHVLGISAPEFKLVLEWAVKAAEQGHRVLCITRVFVARKDVSWE